MLSALEFCDSLLTYAIPQVTAKYVTVIVAIIIENYTNFRMF